MTANKANIHLPQPAKIVRAEWLTANKQKKLFELRLENGRELGYLPGQFVEVSVFGIGEAPISITSSPTSKGSFELAVRAVGNVTNALIKLEKSDTLGIRGPFGNGYPIPSLLGRDILIVAGGTGLFPLRSLIHYLLDNRKSFGRIIIFFGAKNPSTRVFLSELAQWQSRNDIEYLETVDQCDEHWTGTTGVITCLFPEVIIEPAKTTAILVGPPAMYKFAIVEAKKKGIADEQIILSLERRMKCGIGKCGHCQINDIYVCRDGPVFSYAQIKHLEEGI